MLYTLSAVLLDSMDSRGQSMMQALFFELSFTLKH